LFPQQNRKVNSMKNKNTKHLEDAMFKNRIASSTDCTGYMVTLPESNEEAENISDMFNVPTSKRTHKKK
ncbi:MAG: hypothetical protein IKU45_00105, partial [Clostridia bacterium]|nr:hypothetical protein [Clostridia bacterium]